MITVSVLGIPAPQGSKSFIGLSANGKPMFKESSDKVKPWRKAVREAAEAAMNGAPPLTGPVMLRVSFFLPRPSSAPKRVLYPVKYPDLDKLLRALMDGLSEGKAWLDDAQVVDVAAGKQFADADHPAGAAAWFEQLEGAVPVGGGAF